MCIVVMILTLKCRVPRDESMILWWPTLLITFYGVLAGCGEALNHLLSIYPDYLKEIILVLTFFMQNLFYYFGVHTSRFNALFSRVRKFL